MVHLGVDDGRLLSSIHEVKDTVAPLCVTYDGDQARLEGNVLPFKPAGPCLAC